MVFFWNETGNWDGTDTCSGMIKDSELRDTAYASNGTVLCNLMYAQWKVCYKMDSRRLTNFDYHPHLNILYRRQPNFLRIIDINDKWV